jgi:hypothetical protein
MTFLIYLLLGYVLSCIIAWCLILGTFTKAFPYCNNTDAANIAIFGPIAVAAGIICCLEHKCVGWMLFPRPYEERWQIFLEQCEGCFSREYFDTWHK